MRGLDSFEQVDEAAIAFGLAPPRLEAEACEVWPENWPAVRVFELVQSQWRTGPGGAVGLDYTALPARCRPGSGGRRGARLLAAVQVMEAEALECFAEQRRSRG